MSKVGSSDVFAEGSEAYARGQPRTACPYAAGTPEREDWLDGWDEAHQSTDEEAKDNL